MATFLLEVGTEELPADFARLVLPRLEEKVRRDLAQKRLKHESVKCTSTPRRLVLIVEGLEELASDSVEEFKGPSLEKAFDNGKPTKAAFGFANRFGVDPSELQIRETPKGEFVFAEIVESGAPTTDLLSEMIPEWIANIQGRRFMRWGTGERRFARPIRWLVALLDKSVIKVTLEGTDPLVKSDKYSRGHRLRQKEVFITSADQFICTLIDAGVQIDRDKRASLIKSLIEKAAQELCAIPDLSGGLLEELNELVESPTLIKGKFENSFLNLPAEVLSNVMRVHQRYIPLYLDNGISDPLSLDAQNKLLPVFLCIANGLPEANDLIRTGNQRVLKARLADAEFFINLDREVTSLKRTEQLSTVAFSEGLGSVLERVSRIEWITSVLVDQLKFSQNDSTNSVAAASLCKHDLVSNIVSEFPELQGVMGAKYLLAEGHERQISLAVMEHYLPRYAGDNLPQSNSGAVVALADRIELLISIFSKGERPSGSSDPYALRRAGNGIFQILWNQEWSLDLNLLILKSIKHWLNLLPNLHIDESILYKDLSDFFRQRILYLLEDSGVDFDLSEAVAGKTIPIERLLRDPTDIKTRADLLANMRESGHLLSVQKVVTRASRLAQKADIRLTVVSPEDVIDDKLFEKKSEHNMLNVIRQLEPIVKSNSKDRYTMIADGLSTGSKALSEFFDGPDSVLVMTDDESIRTNRLNLLVVLRNQANILADFDQIK